MGTEGYNFNISKHALKKIYREKSTLENQAIPQHVLNRIAQTWTQGDFAYYYMLVTYKHRNEYACGVHYPSISQWMLALEQTWNVQWTNFIPKCSIYLTHLKIQLLGHDAMSTGKYRTVFQTRMLPPSSWESNERHHHSTRFWWCYIITELINSVGFFHHLMYEN